MRNAFADEITKLAKNDDRIILLSGDIGNRLFDNLKAIAPSQFYNCGVAEANMVGVASGMALCDLLPVVYTITPFTTTRCLEQIRVDVAYQNSPVLIVGTGSGLSYTSLGPTHHSLEDFSIFKAIPNLQILAPWDSVSLRLLLKEALYNEKPTYMRIGKKGEEVLSDPDGVPPINEGGALQEKGEHICIVAVGTISSEAKKAMSICKKSGLNPGLSFIHTVKPLPLGHLNYIIENYKKIVTVEEHSVIGGFGESLSKLITEKRQKTMITCLGTSDEFLHKVGSQAYGRKFFNIDAESIAKAVQSINLE